LPDAALDAAVRDAERVILAIEPTAARFRGTDMPVTAEAITAAAAVAYAKARASADELHAISHGAPMVLVRCKQLHLSAAGIRYALDPTQ
jgi:hypothetical protein